MLTMKKTFKPQFFDLRQSRNISIGITADDHEKLKADAKQAGMTLADFIKTKLTIPTAAQLKAMRAEREKEYRERNPFLIIKT
jgi:hypothetical protein